MCGIYGQYNPLGADLALIERMALRLAHRGPDGYGTYHNGGALAFGAGRLAIIDLAAGVQPIFNEDGSISVVFNGEIYNFPTLREELAARGHQFYTHCDTEVIVHLYEEMGADCIKKLRGMFAIALYDEKRKLLLLAATEIFLDKGYDGTTIEDVAMKAAVSKPTVYRFFSDKERLFAEIVLATTEIGRAHV